MSGTLGTISTITGTITTGITLVSPAFTDPVTIAAGAAVGNDSTVLLNGKLYPVGDAIYAASAWTIQNDGTVSIAAGPQALSIVSGNTSAVGSNAAIYLHAGGDVTNAVSGSIYGGNTGIYISGAPGTVVNEGSIAGYSAAVSLAAGGYVENAAGGNISNGGFGSAVIVAGAGGTVQNDGTVSGFSTGILLKDGGTVANSGGGSIYGFGYGVEIKAAAGTVINQGSISGHTDAGVEMYYGGSVTNAVGGIITTDGIGSAVEGFYFAPTTVFNQGSIFTQGHGIVDQGQGDFGVHLVGNGSVTNAAGGYIQGYLGGVYIGNGFDSSGVADAITNAASATIVGSNGDGIKFGANTSAAMVSNQGTVVGSVNGIYLLAGGTVVNAGLIESSGHQSGDYAIKAGSGNLDLDIQQGSTIIGAVVAAIGYTNILELGSFVGGGTIDGIGTQFENFTTIEIDAGANWVLSGGAAALANGDLANSTTIAGFAAGDTIDLVGVTFSGEAGVYGIGPGYGYLDFTNANGVYQIDFTGLPTNPNFSLSDDGNGGTDIVLGAVTCFVRGTLIRTDRGEVAVEGLAIGGRVVTAYGAVQTIKWIGRRGYDGRFIKGNHLALPVCIKADAIADGVPSRDLFVSPGHGMFVDGVLVPAWRLINGVSITQAEAVERVEYFHIELEEHDIILAENCPAESFLDLELRAQFQNVAEFHALYPDAVSGAFALPRVDGGFVLQAIHRKLAVRAGVAVQVDVQNGSLRGYVDLAGPEFITGWVQNLDEPESPVCLDILLDGKRIGRVLANEYRADLREAGLGNGCHAFAFKCAPGMVGDIEVRRVFDQAVLPFTDTLAGAMLARAA
jgi:hypothetical protein